VEEVNRENHSDGGELFDHALETGRRALICAGISPGSESTLLRMAGMRSGYLTCMIRESR